MPITIKVPTGNRITVDADVALIGRDRSCQIALPDEPALQPIHARIRKVANRWLIEAQGEWQLQVGTGLPGRMSWLMPGDMIRLTESGPEIIFDEARPAPAPSSKQPPATVVAAPIAAVVQQAAPSAAMVEEWFYASHGEKCGPFSGDQLKQLAEVGVLLPEDMIWKAGMTGWVPAKSVKALFPQGGHAKSPSPLPPSAAAPALPTPTSSGQPQMGVAEMGKRPPPLPLQPKRVPPPLPPEP